MLWILLACASSSPLVTEAWVLEGPGVLGQLSAPEPGCGGKGATIGLWGATWGTAGQVPVDAMEEDGVLWLSFPIQTGVGEGIAALRVQGDDVRVPLGARSGEFDLALTRAPGVNPAALLEAAAQTAQAGIAAERAAWQQGDFLLMDGADAVGEVSLRGDAPPMISVHDITWLTPDPVVASRADDGGDLLLVFPVEPTLEDEEALIRVNVLTRAVVVPSQAVPSPMDRRLQLVAGSLSDAERAEAVAAAISLADAAEVEWLEEAGADLARRARRSGGCAEWAELPEEWRLMLAGYEVEITTLDGDCALEVSPDWRQHRRRYSGVIGADEAHQRQAQME
ncbi:MAG: hypothetical protein P8R54_17935 [Myxococcota bacterium]|nr:hypothetical protein [Myxococcota bacterium]